MAMRQQTVQRYGGFPIPAIVVRDAWEALFANNCFVYIFYNAFCSLIMLYLPSYLIILILYIIIQIEQVYNKIYKSIRSFVYYNMCASGN